MLRDREAERKKKRKIEGKKERDTDRKGLTHSYLICTAVSLFNYIEAHLFMHAAGNYPTANNFSLF